MYAKFVILSFLAALVSSENNNIQGDKIGNVHENTSEVTKRDKKSVEDKQSTPVAVYEPYVFQFSDAVQQDPLKQRYASQQQVDMQNLSKRLHFISKQYPLSDRESKELMFPIPHAWKVSEPTIIHQKAPPLNGDLSKHEFENDSQDPAEIERIVNQIEILRNTLSKNKTTEPVNKTVWQEVPTIKNTRRSKQAHEVKRSVDRSGTEISESGSKDTRRNDRGRSFKEMSSTRRSDTEQSNAGERAPEKSGNEKRDTETSESNRQDYLSANGLGPVIYVPPSALGLATAQNTVSNQQKSEAQLHALNALIGQSPKAQLEGLKQLLNTPGHQVDIQGPRPFRLNPTAKQNQQPTRYQASKGNHQNHVAAKPDSSTQGSSQEMVAKSTNFFPDIRAELSTIQAQLDAEAEAQARLIIAKAQQDAMLHVDAQHKAIAAAQLEAEREAVARIQAQSGRVNSHIQQSMPQMLNLIHVLPVNQAPIHQTQLPLQSQNNLPSLVQIISQNGKVNLQPGQAPAKPDILQITSADAIRPIQNQILPTKSEHQRLQSQQSNNQLVIPYSVNKNHQALPLTQSQHQASNNEVIHSYQESTGDKQTPVSSYTVKQEHPVTNVGQNLGKIKPKGNLKKIRVTKTHSVKQGHQTPNAYQEVILQTQKQTEKSFPRQSKQTKREEQSEDHQYASRYAFGYKIKDFHKGNDFGHEETREGKSTKGQYHVLLPDGRMQKVEYYADNTGYHAKVTYENPAHH